MYVRITSVKTNFRSAESFKLKRPITPLFFLPSAPNISVDASNGHRHFAEIRWLR